MSELASSDAVSAAEAPVEQRVLESLREIIDPCSVALGRPLDLVEMGLVEHVRVRDRQVEISLVLTDAACAFFQDLRRQIQDVAGGVDGVDAVEVQIAPMLWSPERMLAGPGRHAQAAS